MEELRELTIEEGSALCSNLAKACSKQLRSEEADLFDQLAKYYRSQSTENTGKSFSDLMSLIQDDLESGYSDTNQQAAIDHDRGSMRALTWGEKVSKILKSLLARYEKQKDALLENTNIYVCEICGFIYIGDVPPEICPVCKVPSFKMQKVQREAI